MSEVRNYPSLSEIALVIEAARSAHMRPATVQVWPDGAIKVSVGDVAEPIDEFAQYEDLL